MTVADQSANADVGTRIYIMSTSYWTINYTKLLFALFQNSTHVRSIRKAQNRRIKLLKTAFIIKLTRTNFGEHRVIAVESLLCLTKKKALWSSNGSWQMDLFSKLCCFGGTN
jgi:hypothetical protein